MKTESAEQLRKINEQTNERTTGSGCVAVAVTERVRLYVMLIHVQSYWSNFILIAFANRDQKYLYRIRANTFFFSRQSLSLPFATSPRMFHCFMQYRWIYFGACALYRYRVSHIFLFVPSFVRFIIHRSEQMRALCVWWWNYITWNVWTSNSNGVVVALAKRQQAHIITCYQWRCVYIVKTAKEYAMPCHAIVFYGVYDVPTAQSYCIYHWHYYTVAA